MKKGLSKIISVFLVVVMIIGSAPLSGFVGLELPKWSELFATKVSAAVYSGNAGSNVTWNINSDTDSTPINVDETKTIECSDGNIVYLFFKPSISGVYTFYSTSNSDTYGYLYDASKTQIAKNDDGGEGRNFSITYDLIGGNEYYWGAKFYSSSVSGTLEVTLTCDHEHINFVDDDGKVATCTEDGYTAGIYCNDCNKWFYGHEEIKASHTDVDEDKICDVCGNNVPIASGTAGANIVWNLYNNGHLELLGFGSMSNYKDGSYRYDHSPWYSYKNDINIITIQEGITSIGNAAFYNCNIESIIIPDSVLTIGVNAFKYCNHLKEIDFGNGVTRIGSDAFYECTALTSVVIPDSVTTIDTSFNFCENLKTVSFGKGLKSIEGLAFQHCALEYLEFPASVINIDENAFIFCYNLINISVDKNNQYYSSDEYGVLFNKDKTRLIKYPVGNRRERYVIPDGVISIEKDAFKGSGGISSIIIGGGANPEIDVEEFEKCSVLKEIIIPNSVQSIGESAFEYCALLQNLIIPNIVVDIGDYAFYGCDSLTNIELPDSVVSVGEYAFASCDNLTSILLSNGLTSIGKYAFSNNKSLIDIIIPDNITTISYGTFYRCSGLTKIVIPKSVTRILEYAFYGCNALKDVYYTGTEDEWKKISIYTRDSSNINVQVNTPLFNATIYYNSNGHVFLGKSQNTNSISSSNQPLLYNSLLITPYPQDSESLISSGMENATVSWGTKSANTTEKDTGVCIPKNEINGSIQITEENHRNYIIPEKVAYALRLQSKATSFPVYMTRKNNESCYISSVIGKKDKEDASKFVDLKVSKIECIDGETATIYVTTCGLTNPTYYIAQDNYKKISSDTGEFSAVDVYNKFDFNGDIVVYAVGSDGSKTEPVKIKLSKKVKLSNSAQALKEMTSINLLGSSGMGFQIDDDFPILGGTSIDFSAFKVPVGVEINGTDVKISLGFDFFENKKDHETGEWEKEWKGFKDNCKSTEKTLNDLDDTYENWQKKWNSLENLKKQYSGKNVFKTGAADKDKGWTCSFLGYIEGKLSDDGKICFKEGSIMASAEFKFKYSQQTAVWVIPAYYYFELGAELSLEGKVYKLVPDRSCPVDWAVTLGVEPKVAVGGGAGIVDFASVGLRGEGSVPIKLEFTKGHLTIDLKGALYAEGQFLFIKGKKKIIDGTTNILDKNLWAKSQANRLPPLKINEEHYSDYGSETVVTVMDREYAENTSSWLGSSSGVRKAPARAAASGGIRFSNLQTSVYNQSQPQVVTVGDKQIMVYVADDSTRDDYNRLCLMYSVNESGTWSTPKAVYDDGNNDASPSLATDGEKVYVSWQKVAKKLTEEDCESEQVMLENMEIYLAEFNAETGCFENAERLTNNSVYDYLPFAVVENEKASVYYAEGNPAGQTNKIVRYSDGSTETLKSSLPYVNALSAVSDEASYSIDTDVTNGLTNDMTVFTVKDGNSSEFEKYVSEEADTTENAYNLLTYGEMEGKQTLFVSDGASVYYQKDGKTQKAFSAVSSISGYLQAVKTDTGLTLLWLGYTDDSTEIFSCSYENGTWSEPVQVSSQGNIISFLSANYAGGTIRGVCNITENQFNESTGDYDIGQTNLTSFVIGDFTDLSISAFAPDETELKPGAETVINCYVTQKGTEDISSLDITVTDTLGTNVNYQQDVELKSGSTINLEITYTVPQDYKGTTITVQINTDNTDKDESDNTVEMETGKTTILLNDKPIEEFDDVYILPLSIENYTALDIENLTLTYSIENYDEDIDNESVKLNLFSLVEDSYNDVRIAVKKDGLVYDEDGFARINIAVYDGKDEISSFVSVIEKSTQECWHAVTEEISEIPATCLEKGRTAGEKCSVCSKILIAQTETDALGHSFTNYVSNNDATCTADGTKTAKCDRCDATETITDVGSTKGHNEEIIPSIEAKCTDTGLSQGKKCSVCGKILVAQTVTASLGHNWGEWTVETVASCTEKGTEKRVCVNDANHVEIRDIDKIAHFEEKIPAEEATCTAIGLTEGKKCSVCGEVLVAQATIPAKGHSFTNYISNGDATCTKDGTKTAKCDRCEVTDTKTDIGSAKVHKIVTDKAVAATCTKTGLTEGSHCSVCGTVIKKQTTVAKKAHSYKNVITKADATKKRSGKITPTCSVCGYKKTATTIYYPKTVTLSYTVKTYTGKAIKPTVTVKDSKGKVVDSKYYTVSYKNNTNVGKATVTIDFKGNYSGTKTLNFTIAPKQVTGLKVSSVKTTSLTLSWSKVTGAKYYKLEKSTDGKKWTTVTTTDKTSYTVKSLKSGTKYQFRVTALDSTKKIAGKSSAVLKTATLTGAPSVTLKSSKSKTATASWKKVTGASKYVVYKSTDGKKWTKVTTTTKTAYTFIKLTGGKKIYVKVTALNAYGKASAASSVKNVTVKK